MDREMKDERPAIMADARMTDLWMDFVFLYHSFFVQGVDIQAGDQISLISLAIRSISKVTSRAGGELPETPADFYSMVSKSAEHLDRQVLDNFFSSQLGGNSDN
jgi:hypothetical protein